MLATSKVETCGECSGVIVDAGDELVCASCGVVTSKEVLEAWAPEKAPQAIDYTGQALGGYLGPLEHGYQERFSKGFSAVSSSFEYLKLVSDFSGRDDSAFYSCAKMIERVCEKLSMPKVVAGQAAVIAKKLFEVKRERTDITTGAVSAYAVISACKIEGVTSVGVKEIVEAHRLLGRRVKTSALIQLSLNSPVKVSARKPEEYLGRVLAHLSSSVQLSRELKRRGVNQTLYLSHLREAASDALASVDQSSRGGHSPCTLAATAVYAGEVTLARRESRSRFLSQKDVAECVQVAEYTVREQYGEIFRHVMQRTERAVIGTPIGIPAGSS
jgi:transcription initiation factor TFIIIB Brf1 subunit/transcription initiation factor TFIIB